MDLELSQGKAFSILIDLLVNVFSEVQATRNLVFEHLIAAEEQQEAGKVYQKDVQENKKLLMAQIKLNYDAGELGNLNDLIKSAFR